MEIAGATLTAALVGVIVVLTKVIEWLMKKNANGKTVKQAKEYNGSGEALTRIDIKLDMLTSAVVELRQSRQQLTEHMAAAESAHERMIERLGDVVTGVERLADSVADIKNIKNR